MHAKRGCGTTTKQTKANIANIPHLQNIRSALSKAKRLHCHTKQTADKKNAEDFTLS